MKSFELYAIHRTHEILLTSFNSFTNNHPSSITFDENLTIGDFDQYTLTFSSMHFLTVQGNHQLHNYYIEILQLGTRLKLMIDGSRVDLIISGIQPKISKDNVQYDYTAQDELSYLWSRHRLGYSYPYTEEEENYGVRNIYGYAKDILKDNFLDAIWKISADDTKIAEQLFTFSIEDSNPYNALIEACNVLGFSFHVNYNNHTINFYQKEKNKFSGYRFRPQVSMKSFSASYDTSEYCSILHVTGGEDEYSQIIPLVPQLPRAFQQYFCERELDNEGKSIEPTWKSIDFLKYPKTYANILKDMLNKDNIKVTPEVDVDNMPVEFTEVTGTNVENNYFIYNPNADDENTLALEEVNEALTFTRIAMQLPTLGQFMYDFSFFQENKLIDKSTVDAIYSIFSDMQQHNVMLKVYTPQYYRLLSSIAKINAKLEAYAEQYEAEYRTIEDKINSSDDTYIDSTMLTNNFLILQDIYNNVLGELTDSYFDMYVNLYGNVPQDDLHNYTGQAQGLSKDGDYFSINNEHLFDDWLTWANKIDIAEENYQKYTTKRKVAEKALIKLKTERKQQGKPETPQAGEYDDQYITLESEIAAADEYINTYKTLINTWTILNGDSETYDVPGKYTFLLGLILSRWTEYSKDKIFSDSIAAKIEKEEEENNKLMKNLYMRYGQYIYEKSYDNPDELDSVGLFNQAVNAFESYNRPQAQYSLTVIDLNCLEQISIPDLTVGSHIRVYNDYIDLEDGIDNNIQYTDNELIVTAITRKLRSADDVQVTVEKVNQTQTLLAKLLTSIAH